MPAIAVIDDRAANRESLATSVENELQEDEDWRVVEQEPLPSLDVYPAWLDENEVAVLIVDERLGEQRLSTGAFSPYSGHDVINFIRSVRPSFPMFVITAHQDDADLQESASEVDDIIDKDAFAKKPDVFVARMLRSGRKYTDEFTDELAELSKLSADVAAGKADEGGKMKLHALQEKLSLAIPVQDVADRAQWLESAEKLISETEQLVRKLTPKGSDK